MSPSASPARPWAWVPSLYFQQGLPYVLVMTVSVILYKNLQLTNTEIALYTSGLYLPWVLKPLWSPLVELLGRKRSWIIAMQGLIAAALAAVALSIPGGEAVRMSLALFWLMAFASASHDIAADGFFLLALSQRQQAAFVGVRSTFYRLANIAGQGGLVYLVGVLAERQGSLLKAWSQGFGLLAALFALLALWHARQLPRPTTDPIPRQRLDLRGVAAVFVAFFRKPAIVPALAFLLLYRFPEAQLLKLATPFLLDGRGAGGLALNNQDVGLAYGTVGLTALTLGGLLGGWIISRIGLRRALWPLVLAMHLPNAVFLWMALSTPDSLLQISAALAVEQFGYGLGFTAYLMFMILVADGPHKTAHYAICTGFMALGMMLPGLWSGWLQGLLGYAAFFGWVLACSLASLAVTACVAIPADFGLREEPAP